MTISPIARTALGDLLGVHHAGGLQFRGVPYAEPPLGERRFAPPYPLSAWTGLRDASQHGPIPPQPPSRLRNVMGDLTRPQSEDCLMLTISTPALDTRSRPVLVWLHGGGYLSGAGSLDWYDGTRLSREGDMVVVGVNYRLGPLGFLYQPEISDGKSGLLDVIAALQWVQQHIRSFGGDPNRVTVAGQSAGAHMIMCLLAWPDTRNLFQRAILQSAPAGLPPFSEAAALEYGNRFLDLLQIERGQTEEVAVRLKAETPTRLIEAMGELARRTTHFAQIAPPFMPVIDEISAPERFLEAAAAGAGVAGIDLIIGTTREEAHAFFSSGVDETLIAERFAALAGSTNALEHYRYRRPGASLTALLSDLVTDTTFLFPSLRFAEAASGAGARSFVYQFDWSPPTSPLQACHCLELPFVFGNLDDWHDAPMLQGTDPDMFAALSGAVRAAWIRFVQKGDPSASVPWPFYKADGRQTMRWASHLGPVGDPAGISWRV
ncbi:para-nitrobenzyl esterase [Reticulibacter mediterranei]|uniref:Carboxylic ester hydrolase n=1 Tax=Reticulibacter mediterranei TaxID=2778369 RepID=A0A8J3IA22_9CHLR|nr:carboxylesterase family protein [Reticulibacter mediterranei]GHO90671.1 para-nitrobenzyl esterase [Reticulibacter mediterranei]